MTGAPDAAQVPGLLRRLRYHALLRLGRFLPVRFWESIEGLAALQQGKGFGTATCELEVRECRRLLGRDPDIVLDVGANRGDYSAAVLATFPRCMVHAVDPSERCIERMETRFARSDRITTHQIGLSDSVGEASLFADRDGSPLASLVNRDLKHFGIVMRPTSVVPTTTLDDFVNVNGLGTIDWIKLDVEGHELAVLRGAEGALSRASLLQFEFGGGNVCSRTFFRDFWQFLTTRGFSIFRLAPGGTVQITGYAEVLEHFRTTNYVCIRGVTG
jgi:FkbM family methyltransferase